MNIKSAYLRCLSCNTLNRVKTEKIQDSPKCGNCNNLLVFPEKTIDIGMADFKKEVVDYAGIVLVDLWSPHCGYCMQLMPVLEQIAKEQKGIVKVVKVNVQLEAQLASQFQVRGVPTLILYYRGKKINQLAGALSKQQLENWIEASVLDSGL